MLADLYYTPYHRRMTEEEQVVSTQTIEGFKSLGLFTADHASVEGGKVYANGAYWSLLRFPVFPATLPAGALVAVIRVPFHQAQSDHELRLELTDADGAKLVEVQGQFRTAPGIEAKYGEPGVLPFVVPIVGLKFEHPGDYTISLDVDGTNLDRYTFHVVQVVGLTMATPLQR
jgi:hypothetical protein